MCSKELLLLAFLLLVGGLHLTATATTTTFVAATSIGNHEMDRFLRDMNLTHIIATEDRILIDFYNYAFLNYTYKKENDELKKVSYSEEKARYGEGRINNVNGKLIHITDKDNLKDDTACSPNILATNGQEFPPQVIKWIALVRRGRCTFEEKVKNVYDRGAVGVIIYNDKEVNNLEKMQIKDQKRDITAVITYLDIGLEMANIIDQGLEMHVDITQGRSGSRPINNLNRTSVLFVSISFIVLMVISLVWLLFYYIQRFRYLQTKDQQSRQLCSVTKKAIMKIPTKTGKISDEKDIDSDCCAICIEAYKPSDCIRVLPCKHEFHKNCIDPWLIEHRTCPMCKLDVLKFYGFVFLGSEESILEYEPDRTSTDAAASTNSASAGTNHVGAAGVPRVGAISDLIRSRDFVIDFPRIYVLEAGGATGTRESLFASRLPERSQSSMSFTQAKDWMSAMTNKLEEQHGIRRLRRRVSRDSMEEHLLTVEPLKKRRSRSADGRYSNSHQARRQAIQLQSALECGYTDEVLDIDSTDNGNVMQTNSTVLDLTDSVHAPSRSRQRQESEMPPGYEDNASRRSVRRSRDMDVQLHDSEYRLPMARQSSHEAGSRESSPPLDVAITIQINGEGIDLE